MSASIGAGHDGAARELEWRLRRHGFVVERLDFLDLLPTGWGAALRGGYSRQLRYVPASWGWLLDAAAAPRARAAASALAATAAMPRLAAALGSQPAVVVSTYPLAGQALGRMRTAGTLAAPVAAVMTDPSVHPLCVADGVDLHLAPSDAAAAAVQAWPSAATTVVRPLVDPAFRPSRGLADACEARERLGLPLVDHLAVVVAGSWGVGDIDGTVHDLAAAGTVTPVVVCGHNESLRRRLARTGPGIVRGWIDDMPSLLRAADVVVHNAGALSCLEALASSVPVISYRCLPGHGVANAAALRTGGLSAWPRSPAALAVAVRYALEGDLRRRQSTAFAALSTAPDAADVVAELADRGAPERASIGAMA